MSGIFEVEVKLKDGDILFQETTSIFRDGSFTALKLPEGGVMVIEDKYIVYLKDPSREWKFD